MPARSLQPFKKLPHLVIIRAPGLLPMLYTAGELAGDLGVPERTLRDWLAGGAPHRRDDGRIWIHGREFAAWVQATRTTKNNQRRTPMRPGEAYCFGCRKPVLLVNPKRHNRGRHVISVGTCPACGMKVSRGGTHG